MTRINTVNQSDLSDDHLRGEYKEITRIFTAVKKLVEKGKTPSDVDIPESFRLGEGHVKFFYNKLDWVSRRYTSLADEMIRRKFKVDRILVNRILSSVQSLPQEWFGSWEPTAEDKYLSMARLVKKSKMEKPLKEIDLPTEIELNHRLNADSSIFGDDNAFIVKPALMVNDHGEIILRTNRTKRGLSLSSGVLIGYTPDTKRTHLEVGRYINDWEVSGELKPYDGAVSIKISNTYTR